MLIIEKDECNYSNRRTSMFKEEAYLNFHSQRYGSFYKTCDGCREQNRARAYNKASREAEQRAYNQSERANAIRKAYCEYEKDKLLPRTEKSECVCGCIVEHNNKSRHYNAKPHQRWVNARKNFASVLVELLATDKQELTVEKATDKQDLTVERAIDYDDRCHGCRRHNDFCRCGSFY